MIAFAHDNIIPMPQKSNEWYTPARYVEAAREVMGSIDLDPASCKEANMVVRASKFYTKEDNGLAQEWFGNIWLNPPYDHPKGWITRFCTDANICQSILLISACTDVGWFDPLWNYLICFKKGRIKYHNPYVRETGAARDPSLFIYRGPHEQRFIDIFSEFGTVARRVSKPKERPVTLSLWGDA